MRNNSGQVLLITVMLLATIMTIVLSVSFKSVTDTQVTKLEEESQKALTAAESAIDVMLKENSADSSITTVALGSGSLTSITGFEGTAKIESLISNTFRTPTVPKDSSYTFYLGNYDTETKTITPVSDPNNLTVCFESGTPNPAIEINLVKTSGVKKYVVDPSSRITNASTGSSCSPDTVNYSYSVDIPSADIGADGQFFVIRVLYNSTRLFFSRSSDLPLQGRTITSQATSSAASGVSKKVVLFQSYPQIPADFFITSF